MTVRDGELETACSRGRPSASSSASCHAGNTGNAASSSTPATTGSAGSTSASISTCPGAAAPPATTTAAPAAAAPPAAPRAGAPASAAARGRHDCVIHVRPGGEQRLNGVGSTGSLCEQQRGPATVLTRLDVGPMCEEDLDRLH